MDIDKRKVYIVSLSTMLALVVSLFTPLGSGRIFASVFLLPAAIIAFLIIKKRLAPSIHSKEVLIIMAAIGVLYFTFYYVSAAYFGLTNTGYGLKSSIIFRLTLPIAIIIAATELIRYVLCIQKMKYSALCAYFICLLADVIIYGNIAEMSSFGRFMDVVGLALFPGILNNLLFNYLTVRYGFVPNIVYRALTVWVFYLIPYGSAISKSMLGLFNVLLPIGIYLFIDSLYEKKRHYALQNTSAAARVASKILTVVVLLIMIFTVALVSNQFYYGSYVIATESMTGELNKGDIAIYERYKDQTIIEGQVIVFEQNGRAIVHRAVDIQVINGQTRYYTKGDANEDMDTGFIYDSSIIGIVNTKLPFLGYPTIWLRSLFAR
ncbi:MAG: signal peptidase I [Clostridia bacterium]|nr:signal peptidase I [Clostridia bacterium]